MSQWRRCILRVLLALVIVFFILLLNFTDAHDENWRDDKFKDEGRERDQPTYPHNINLDKDFKADRRGRDNFQHFKDDSQRYNSQLSDKEFRDERLGSYQRDERQGRDHSAFQDNFQELRDDRQTDLPPLPVNNFNRYQEFRDERQLRDYAARDERRGDSSPFSNNPNKVAPILTIPDTVYYHDVRNEIPVNEYYDDDMHDVTVDEEEAEYDTLIERPVYEEPYPSSRPELPHCTKNVDEKKHSSAVVVSTLDGRVTGMDMKSGAVLWSHQTGRTTKPLLASSMSKLEVTSGGEWVRLIPSLDGGIFRFDGEGVEALPVTAQNLLHSSFKFNADTIFTGGKATEVWGLALNSGRIVYVCNTLGCKRNRTAAKPAHVLVVRRVTQTVRAVDPKSGDERWNFSVGQHEVNMAGSEGCNGGNSGTEDDEGGVDEDMPALHFVVPDGVVMGVNTQTQMVWKQKLASPVVNAWKVVSGVVEEVDLFSTANVPALSPNQDFPHTEGESTEQPALYVGVHQKQLYIQQSGPMQHRVTYASKVFTADTASQDPENELSREIRFPRVQWRPYLATAPSRTPILHNTPPRLNHPLLDYTPDDDDTALSVIHQAEYPFDNGYYLYADPSLGTNFSRPWERPRADVEEEKTVIDEVTDHIIHFCFHIGPDMWLHLALGGAIYLVFHFLVLRYLIIHMRRRITQQAIIMARNTVLMLLRSPYLLRLIQNMGIHLPALLPPPAPPPAPAPAQAPPISYTASTSSQPPSSEKSESSSPEYTSRYLTDFELVQCLGRGGFGMVFQVRNKLDENEYAVKRIILPSKESSAERVKREVRALAKLNHSNIVRYYNSWLESPPPGWQDEMDALWKNSDVMSVSLLSPSEDTSPKEGGAWPGRGVVGSDSSLAPLVNIPTSSEWTQEKADVNTPSLLPLDTKESDGNSDGIIFKNSCEFSEMSSSLNKTVSCNKAVVFKESCQEASEVSEDSSFDVVFENSENSGVNSDGEEDEACEDAGGEEDDSFSMLFEKSTKLSVHKPAKDSLDKDKKLVKNSSKIKKFDEGPRRLWCDTGVHSYSDSSMCLEKTNGKTSDKENESEGDSIVFEDSRRVNVNCDSQTPVSRSWSQECSSSKIFRKRRRTKSCNNPRIPSTGERPTSLSLASEEMKNEKIAEQDKVEVPKILNPRTFLYIQMELCQKESLRDWLVRNQTREKQAVISIFNDIVKAVEYVHDNHLMHRDLKPSNIFFSLDGEVKIGDFGLVTTIAEEEGNESVMRTPVVPLPPAPASTAPPRRHTHRVGTQLYMSPEQVNGAVYDYKVDIFSLGLVLLEMLLPFTTGMERLHVMTEARASQFPQDFHQKYPDETSLLKLMLSHDPYNRPTTRGIRARPPLRDLQSADALNHIHPSHHFSLPRHRPHSSTSTSASLSSNPSN